MTTAKSMSAYPPQASEATGGHTCYKSLALTWWAA
jgi:hypothetical protein